MDDIGLDTNVLLALVKSLADAQITATTGASLAGGYVKVKTPSFSGKQKDWLLFKMQLQAYLSTLELEGVLEETTKMRQSIILCTIHKPISLFTWYHTQSQDEINMVFIPTLFLSGPLSIH